MPFYNLNNIDSFFIPVLIEGKWEFQFDEEARPGCLTLDIAIQKHLSSSLIDVDVHPTYISIVIKSKTLRLNLPVEVKSEESSAQRSSTTGHLMVQMPKVICESSCNIIEVSKQKRNEKKTSGKTTTEAKGKISLQQEMILEAQNNLTGPVTLKGLVKEKDGGVGHAEDSCASKLDMVECSSRRTFNSMSIQDETLANNDDDESPPPLL